MNKTKYVVKGFGLIEIDWGRISSCPPKKNDAFDEKDWRATRDHCLVAQQANARHQHL